MNVRLNMVFEKVERLGGRYNAENDIVPGQPIVSWADMELAEAVNKLAEVVNELERRIEELEK